MKKKTVLFTALGVGSLITVIPAAMMINAAMKGNSNQIVVPEFIYYEDFETFKESDSLEHQPFYLDFANAEIVTSNAIEGKSAKVNIPHKLNWGSLNFKSELLGIRNSKFHIDFSVKTKDVDSIDIPVLKNYDNEYFAQYGVKISNDINGYPTSLTYRVGDALIDEDDITHTKRDLTNGVISIGFDFEVGDALCFPSIKFHSVKDHAFAIIDNIVIQDLLKPGETYDVQYQSTFDDIVSSDVFNSTPFWCQNGSMDFVKIDNNQMVQYSGYYGENNGDNTFLGGITRTELTTIKNTLYYYSYDIRLENIQELVITTLDNRDLGNIYSEITYRADTDKFLVTAQGGINNFSYTKDGDVYHITYNRQTSSFGEDEHKLFATNINKQSKGKVIIDNFVVAHK